MFFFEISCRFAVELSQQHLAAVIEAKGWRDNDETGYGFSWAANGNHSVSPRRCESPQPLFDQAILVPSDMKLRYRSRSQRSGRQRCPAMLAPRLPAARPPTRLQIKWVTNHSGPLALLTPFSCTNVISRLGGTEGRLGWFRDSLCVKRCHSYQVLVFHKENVLQHTNL